MIENRRRDLGMLLIRPPETYLPKTPFFMHYTQPASPTGLPGLCRQPGICQRVTRGWTAQAEVIDARQFAPPVIENLEMNVTRPQSFDKLSSPERLPSCPVWLLERHMHPRSLIGSGSMQLRESKPPSLKAIAKP